LDPGAHDDMDGRESQRPTGKPAHPAEGT
jgi:hypothetical protein